MRRFCLIPAVLAVCALPASPRVMVVFRLASPPLPVETGQQFSLCAANVGATNIELTLQLVSVRTGVVAAAKDLILPPPGAGPMPDPCLTATAQVIAAAGSPPAGEQPLVTGLVIAKRGLFARAGAATASIQITAAAPSRRADDGRLDPADAGHHDQWAQYAHRDREVTSFIYPLAR